MTKFFCPRAVEEGGGPDSPFKPPFNGETEWKEDGTCGHCGSLNSDTFIARLEAGDVELVPTDKNYKVYIRNKGGAPFKQTHRDCPKDSGRHGPDECTHWVTREVNETKFYFQHLSQEQRTKFIELYNGKKISLAYPGHFYVLPYFCSVA